MSFDNARSNLIRNPKSVTGNRRDVAFRDLPRQSALFLKYLDQDADALCFYPCSPTLDNLERFSKEIAARSFPRREMAAILRRQNESFGADDAVFQQIDMLEKPDSVAIITGQQTGIFIGPLYTIYKTLTAIKLAEELRRRGINAIPVFWMESEDHDLAEATHCTVLDSETSARSFNFSGLFDESETATRSVGSLRFSENIREAAKEYLGYLPDSEWKSEVQSLIESAYAPGASFAEAFARAMRRIFQGTGLALFNPNDADAKRLAAPVFLRAVSEAERIYDALVQRDEELRALKFHTQTRVLENATLLFLVLDGKRRALERNGANFRLKNSEREFTGEELAQYAEKTPALFSPNVLLRPIVQDHLFPTAAYVGGAAEIAYFAQAETLYRLFSRSMPAIWPRNGFTLIEPEIAANMKRLNIGFEDCFTARQALLEKVLAGYSRSVENLDNLYDLLDRRMLEIQPDAQAVEERLGGATDLARRKILSNVRYLKSRVVRLEAEAQKSVAEAADAILNHCRPRGNLQERELTIFHFLSRYGAAALDKIRSAIDPENFHHRLLNL